MWKDRIGVSIFNPLSKQINRSLQKSILVAGTLQLHGCGVTSFLDWYSVFQNPSEKFVDTIYCDSEVVYPL